ncbi:MAG: hypothetical protein WCO82_00735 [Sphingomonadales bacterium]
MRPAIVILALALAACSSDVAPEQAALARAQAALARAGQADAMVLAPLFGLDAVGQAGLCGLLETPAGPVRLVVALRDGTVRLGKPLAQQRLRQDLGESRFCTLAARARWQRQAAADPNGLVAELGD